jgi:inner membrane protease subunit 1
MLPTFNMVGDIVLADMRAWKLTGLPWGSIIMFISPENPDKRVTKRIIGLPGDTIFVDPTNQIDPHRTITVPQGHVWTQGDNYDFSNDSRSYGPLPIGLIKGRIFAKVYWPFTLL